MSETTQTPAANTPEGQQNLSYDTYRRAIAEKKKLQKQFEELQSQLNEINQAKEKEEQKRIEETGKYKELYEKLKSDFEAKSNEVTNYVNELNSYKEQIAGGIPEAIRETFDIANLTVKQLQVLADNYKIAAHTPGSQASGTAGSEVDVTKMDFGQLNQLAATNPAAYNDYMTKYFNKK